MTSMTTWHELANRLRAVLLPTLDADTREYVAESIDLVGEYGEAVSALISYAASHGIAVPAEIADEAVALGARRANELKVLTAA